MVYSGRLTKITDEQGNLKSISIKPFVESKMVEGACWYQPNGPGSHIHNKREHPVVQIALEDALAYAAWIGCRIPTEEEWEAAARSQQGLALPWGDDWIGAACNCEDSFIGDTTPVDKYLEYANPLGVVDTIGNVLEWTVSLFEGSNGGAVQNIVKGGSWIDGSDIRLYSRFLVSQDTRSNILGFRCVVI